MLAIHHTLDRLLAIHHTLDRLLLELCTLIIESMHIIIMTKCAISLALEFKNIIFI